MKSPWYDHYYYTEFEYFFKDLKESFSHTKIDYYQKYARIILFQWNIFTMALLKIMYNVDSLLGINNDTLLLAKIFTFSISISTFNWSSWRKKQGLSHSKKKAKATKIMQLLYSEIGTEMGICRNAEIKKCRNRKIESRRIKKMQCLKQGISEINKNSHNS